MDILEGLSERQREAVETIDEDLPNLKLLRLDANTIDTVFNKNID